MMRTYPATKRTVSQVGLVLFPNYFLILAGEQYGSTTGADFRAVIDEAVRAIHNGIFPERIVQGSSGSYFVKNMAGV